MDLGTPVMSVGLQENTYPGWMATFIPSAMGRFMGDGSFIPPPTISQPAVITILMWSVTVPPSTRNFNIPWAVDSTD
ncbi:hypothetical protein Tco_1543169 [Tanacetum coccineum]